MGFSCRPPPRRPNRSDLRVAGGVRSIVGVRWAFLASALLAGAGGAWACASPAAAQSVVDRPPNLHGTWTGDTGTLQFNLMHRFTAGDAPERAVRNTPTFLLATGVPGGALLGARYATSSPWIRGFPNEWEFFARHTPISESQTHPLDVSLTAAYNQAADSFDGQLTLARTLGPVRLLASGRAFSRAFREPETRTALAAGATLRLTPSTALAADVASLLDRADDERVAWSAGIQIHIPTTPHSLSIHASNAHTTTLQGGSVGGRSTLWGFEFTVPVTLSRYIGRRPAPAAAPESEGEFVEEQGVRVFEVGMDAISFAPETIQIRAGNAIRWTNDSPLFHTVTTDPELVQNPGTILLPEGVEPFHSGDLLPGESYTRVFETPGEYVYVCVPHEAAGMLGRIIVTD